MHAHGVLDPGGSRWRTRSKLTVICQGTVDKKRSLTSGTVFWLQRAAPRAGPAEIIVALIAKYIPGSCPLERRAFIHNFFLSLFYLSFDLFWFILSLTE